MKVVGQSHAPATLLPGNTAGTHSVGGNLGPRALWTGAENLTPTRVRSPDRPPRNESLYQLSYPGPHKGDSSILKRRAAQF
jgi:hypothetical protein